ncbi:NusG domain II-containing protein [uncultured Megamonas sp.]|uniref:NusG domain II-containing protein n=1 Tax=uncultured Megamonas sp. TaxID=286140 RepID=UPI00266F8AD0|nr:NusG domain II-containing protein [uncultured Megamonas sp.]
MNNINKSVICIVLVIIFIAVFIGLRNSFAEKTNTVEIIQDGNIIYTLDLDESEDELIQVDFQGHKNIIQIKDKKISIIEADCPDKICVNMGILKSAFIPIVCLPNHLVIQYVNDDEKIDATAN